MTLASELTDAVARGQIEVFFQPQIDLATGRLVSVESLSRWRHPLRGMIPPLEYISDAENSGEIHALGAFMLTGGCRASAKWSAGGRPVEVAVNVSPVQLSVPVFFDEVVDILSSTPLNADQLIIEVTESRVIVELEVATRGLTMLKSLGVAVSIDDFGVGFSSLEQLRSLPSTELKLDRSLTQSDAADSEDAMAAVIETAHAMGVRVVAEGVETQFQLDRVTQLGCDRGQGFLLGYPMSETEMDALLASDA